MQSRVRIIGGRWKRRLLPVLDLEGLRPTPDRVREVLFNWLGQELTGWRCLELFAGTGVLGFEAASRGAAQVTLVERHPRLVRALEASREMLQAEQVTVARGDALAWLDAAPAADWDLVLLDPPYHDDWMERLLPVVQHRLASDGRVYAECEFMLTDGWLQSVAAGSLTVLRAGRAGQVHYHLLGLSNARPSIAGSVATARSQGDA